MKYKLRQTGRTLRVAFTYIGTIVGAGFATGQEILFFFSRFGAAAVLTILFSIMLMVWLGSKVMVTAHELQLRSYADMNEYLFGRRLGVWFSRLTLVLIFGLAAVMLAGAGSVFSEHFGLSYQIGLAVTMIFAYLVTIRGMNAIMNVNTVVVPAIIVFTLILVAVTTREPGAANWVTRPNDHSWTAAWFLALLYSANNLCLSQAVLVPLGSSLRQRNVVLWGGVLGALGIGLLLMCGHFAMSSQMPGITQFEIPMGVLVFPLGRSVQYLFLLLIYAEIFTTYIANVYGLTVQFEQMTRFGRRPIVLTLLGATYLVSQLGFSRLLSNLYPLFGVIGVVWLIALIIKNQPKLHKS